MVLKMFFSPLLNPHSVYSVNIGMCLLLTVSDLVAFAVDCVVSRNVNCDPDLTFDLVTCVLNWMRRID